MVLLKTTLALLGLINMAAFAAPVAKAAEAGILAAQASIFMCKDTRWNGQCQNVLVDLNTCRNVPAGWNDQISSIRNDSRSNYRCTWYLDANCGGRSYDNQDDADLSDGNGRFNDSISSYSCKER